MQKKQASHRFFFGSGAFFSVSAEHRPHPASPGSDQLLCRAVSLRTGETRAPLYNPHPFDLLITGV